LTTKDFIKQEGYNEALRKIIIMVENGIPPLKSMYDKEDKNKKVTTVYILNI
jgi:hypothetical protein